MKWHVKKVGKYWKVYLMAKYCLTTEAVCYGSSLSKRGAEIVMNRLNKPL